MGGFFSTDGLFYKVTAVIADALLVTLLWIICSLPIVTIGAATSAGYYIMTRRISGRNGYIVKDFFMSFVQNFIQSTLFTILFLVCYFILYFNLTHMKAMGDLRFVLRPIQLIIAAELTLTMLYVFPLLSRFKMGMVEILRTSVFMANRHLLTTITCLFLLLALVWACLFFNPFLFVLSFGLYAFASSHMLMRIFKKYRPDMDSDEDAPPNH